MLDRRALPARAHGRRADRRVPRGRIPAASRWREPPYEYEHDKQPIDILYGSDRLRTAIDAGGDVGSARRAAGRQTRRRSGTHAADRYLLYLAHRDRAARDQLDCRCAEVLRFACARPARSRICRACLCAWSA